MWFKIEGSAIKRDERVVGVFLFIFGAVTAGLSVQLKIGTLRKMESGFFPFILGIMLMILSALYVIRSFFGEKKPPGIVETPGASKGNPVSEPPQTESPAKAQAILGIPLPALRTLATFGIMILAVFFFDKLGYLLTSFFVMAGCLWILGSKNWLVTLGTALATALISYSVFVKLLHVILPRGLISF